MSVLHFSSERCLTGIPVLSIVVVFGTGPNGWRLMEQGEQTLSTCRRQFSIPEAAGFVPACIYTLGCETMQHGTNPAFDPMGPTG